MYAKLFQSMYDGTLATKGPWEALVTFQQLLILADRFGIVDMTQDAISRRTTIPLEIICKGITTLEEPDANSRKPELNGRRIVRLSDNREWGWQIVNYEHYKQIRTAEERRDYQRRYMRGYREKHKGEPKQPKQPKPQGDFKLPAWLDADTFNTWISSRPARSKTPAAKLAALDKLSRFKEQGLDPNAIVKESIANGWQGIFAPSSSRKNGQSGVEDRNREAAEAFLRGES